MRRRGSRLTRHLLGTVLLAGALAAGAAALHMPARTGAATYPSAMGPLVANHNHSCALLSNGAVVCWGRNSVGQLGNNGTLDSAYPVPVSGVGGTGTLTGVAALSAGLDHTCALLTAGGVVCWGDNTWGQMGQGDYGYGGKGTPSSRVPVAVKGAGGTGTLGGVKSLSAGGGHTCAVFSTGGVDCWGSDLNGEIGDNGANGFNGAAVFPTPVTGIGGSGTLSGVAGLASGADHTCARLSSGGVDCWGRNLYGELGDGTTTEQIAPVAVKGVGGTGTLTAVSALALGYEHSCALLTTGAVDCWGHDDWGQLGDNGSGKSTSPVAVQGVGGSGSLGGVSTLVAGERTNCVLVSGAVECWGSDYEGELGGTGHISSGTPLAIAGISGTQTDLATGSNNEHMCSLGSGGAITCWGTDTEGQLGNSTIAPEGKPGRVAFPTSVSVTPVHPRVAKGATQQFIATAAFDTGSSGPVTNAAWTSSTPATFSITPAGVATASGALGGTATITATIATTTAPLTGSTVATVGDPTVKSIAVTPASATIPRGGTQQLTATGTYADGTTGPLSGVTWTSSNPANVSVTSAGVATAAGAAGSTATITAASGSASGTTPVTVGAAALKSIAVTPANATIPMGGTQQLAASGTYTDGTTGPVSTGATWASSAATVATVSTGGLATAKGPGSTAVSITAAGVTGSTVLTVVQAPAITSAATSSFATGKAGTFTVTTTGYPACVISESGALPSGVTFTDNHNGTATLAGTPAAGSAKTYTLTITAINGAGTTTQTLTLTVT